LSGFSIDDILAEVDKKRGVSQPISDGKTSEIDEILNKKTEKPEKSEDAEKQRVSRFSAVSKPPQVFETPEIPDFPQIQKVKEVTKTPEVVPPPLIEEYREVRETIKKPERTDFRSVPAPKRKREKRVKTEFKTADIVFKKAMVVPKPVIDDGLEEIEQIPETPEVQEVVTESKLAEPSTAPKIAEITGESETAETAETADSEKREKSNRGASVSIGAKDGDSESSDTSIFDFPKLEITQVLEKLRPSAADGVLDEALKKRGEALLERDLSLEQPLEQIDALNPYDMLDAVSGESEDSENPEKNLSITDDFFGNAKFTSLLSGDTKGIADGDLKEMQAKSAENIETSKTAEIEQPEPDSESVRTYMPGEATASLLAESVGATIVLSEKAKRSNTALVESLNNALRKKRESDVNAYRTLTVEGGFVDSELGAESFENRVTHGLNIDYKKQIISDTAISLSEDPMLAEQRLRDLAGKRKRKIRDFVLEDIEDEKDPNYYEEEQESDEFDDYDTSGQIWSDLCETHKGLKIRFAILFILTGFTLFLTFMNDFGFSMAYNIFGTDLLLFDKSYEPTGFLILNLVLGITGTLVCSTVVRGGLAKLFSGRGDCDSLCAVPAVLSVLCVLPHLSGESYFMQGFTNIFVAAGLSGLLFNTVGKLMMMSRAKRNFRFVSGDSPKYYAEIIEDEQISRAFTKGTLHELPVLCGMRKTEFLTDFLKNSYCNDRADLLSRFLTPAAFAASVIVGLAALFIPYENPLYDNNIFWALTAANATLCLLSPISIMFLVNNPLLRASKALSKNDAVVLGYNSAERFSRVNSVLVDASSLFPAGSVDFRNLKRCQQENSLNRFAIDDAIITAASLAIKSGSILTSMFYDMIAGKSELLYEIDNCIYEVNMGISGWLGNKRVMLGNREQMKHHGIKVPDIKKEQQYSTKFGEVVYLAVGGETIAMFFLKIVPNEQIKQSLQSLQRCGVSVIVRTRDSLVTVHSLAETFELAPESLKVIPFDLHSSFDDCTKYTSRGDGNVACNGTFSSFAGALAAAKKVTHNIILSSSSLFIGLLLAVILSVIFTIFANVSMLSPTNVVLYNGIFFVLLMLMQGFKRY